MNYPEFSKYLRVISLIACTAIALPSSAFALNFSSGQLQNGVKFIAVEGEFGYNDSLSEFTTLVKQTDPTFVSFNSPGGSRSRRWSLVD
ncbi:hypothetical protein J2X72_001376 [Phyllobacterium sp. 1468]|uniref:hypothetical protein n=1 Tax=Phyllobacterium sp. 1468 TaxID=2817759 RepID=UPI00285AD09F|nr:hypothetical protein [Phyllobacterium sp. 1468]MDR6632592.1 hypothetical protein [Phyllobacterium sp. 1468]